MDATKLRTTVSVNRDTKARLDKDRATGKCYDGFLCQLVDLWEQAHNGNGRHGAETLRHKFSSDSHI